jgi:hypothetical protein
MKQATVLFALVLGLVSTGVLVAATTADHDLEIVAAKAGSTYDCSVLLTTRNVATQGWSFGVMLEADAGLTAKITEVAAGAGLATINNGGPAGFLAMLAFGSGSLQAPAGDCKVAPCTGDFVALTQGVVVDLFSVNVLPAGTNDFVCATFKVAATLTGDTAAAFRAEFTDTVGDPATPTVMVVGGGSFPPEVQTGVEVLVEPAICAPAASFTIDIPSAEGDTDAEVVSIVTLNFDDDGLNGGKDIQGWSYGVCVADASKLAVVAATSDGTPTATINGGKAPGFESVVVNPLGVAGVTHGIVIDLFSVNKIPSQNGWQDLAVTYKILMSAEGDSTYVAPCDATLADPPVANVMVIGGASIAAQTYEGSPADRGNLETGCCDPEACNRPGTFSFVAPPAEQFFVPGSANGDGKLDLADGIYILSFLFRGGAPPPCMKAADVNGDCAVDSSDAIAAIYYVLEFGGQLPPVLGTGCQVVPAETCPALTCELNECAP